MNFTYLKGNVMDNFKTGDLVSLKSGGPKMTVFGPSSNLGPSNRVRCQWFAGKKLEHGDFMPDSLMPVKNDDSE
ncbi:YodC family protein [Providencia sp. Me31A]|uniref:YodC family protein n=2 Tax=unclassified Providencia TaxID=2633465 RepID=UPI0027D32860